MTTPSADDVRTLTDLETSVMRALQTKDLATIKALTAEDFVYRSADGSEIDRETFVASIGEIPGGFTSVEAEAMKAHVFGDTGVMAGIQRSQLRMTDGSEATDRVYFTDVWQRRGGKWLMVFSHSSPVPPADSNSPEPVPQQ
ncbi:nuclear transport factor 2 family protein [Myxococcus sp. Y35]|uniref:nuclear transport factor 2 family protein n=1 Tax=Pseudomyxococcus flavus TaxID=3115648 RepID=UPI003CE7200F